MNKRLRLFVFPGNQSKVIVLKMFNRPTFMAILAVGLLISTVTLVYYIFSLQSEELYPSSANGRRPKARYNDSSIDINPFPTIVHHTWKTGSDPPAETVRWRKGCIALNPSYEFRMYDDDDLMKFTADHYPRYLPMLKKLKGVCKYMFYFINSLNYLLCKCSI